MSETASSGSVGFETRMPLVCAEEQVKLMYASRHLGPVSHRFNNSTSTKVGLYNHLTFCFLTADENLVLCRCSAYFRRYQVCFIPVSNLHKSYDDRARHIREGFTCCVAFKMRHASCWSFVSLSTPGIFASTPGLRLKVVGLEMPETSAASGWAASVSKGLRPIRNQTVVL